MFVNDLLDGIQDPLRDGSDRVLFGLYRGEGFPK